jgi:hypothetical protein
MASKCTQITHKFSYSKQNGETQSVTLSRHHDDETGKGFWFLDREGNYSKECNYFDVDDYANAVAAWELATHHYMTVMSEIPH